MGELSNSAISKKIGSFNYMKNRFSIILLRANNFVAFFKFYSLRIKCIVLIPIGFFVKSFFSSSNRKNEVWVIGENFGECLKDNGYCFFKYCQATPVKPAVFFVVKKNFLQDDIFLSSNRNVLVYGSIQHIVYLFLADVYIYSHTHRDIIFHKLFLLFAKNKKIVFLQHGVTGFKKFDPFYQEYCNEPDILIVVSNFEKSIIAKHVGTDEKKIKITGFARYDNLENSTASLAGKQIAYMPTWRDWITKGGFLDSKFFKCVSAFTDDGSLSELLEKRNFILKFYLHKNMKEYFSFFDSNHFNIKLIKFGQENVQKMIKESNLLITDYSSVSWDFFYLDKPVIFFQFDSEDYLRYRGSYLNLKKDLFGDLTSSIPTLIDFIKFYINNDFQIKEKFRLAKPYFFNYFDKYNSQRIYQEIVRL